jgi:hypothetical protein
MTRPKAERARRDELFAQGLQYCPKCKDRGHFDDFHKNAGRKDGLASWCKDCITARNKQYRENNKESIAANRKQRLKNDPGFERRQHLKSNYNLTGEQWDAMLESQGGVCAICGTDTPGGVGTWHVDHDHACCPKRKKSCGKCVRGLLCNQCNVHLPDSFERVLQMMQYLQNHGSITVQLAKAA